MEVGSYARSHWRNQKIDVRFIEDENFESSQATEYYELLNATALMLQAKLEKSSSLKSQGYTNDEVKVLFEQGLSPQEIDYNRHQYWLGLGRWETGSAVWDLQRLLNVSADSIPQDGIFSLITTNRLKTFQESKGLGFDKLREILLEKDWEEREELAQKLVDLDDQLNSRNRLEEKIQPIFDDERKNLRDKFPELFGPQITATISKQIRESQDEVVEALYPILGRMIKKYITSEIEKLSEKIDEQMKLAFSWEGWKMRIKAWISGTPQQSMMISKLIAPKIEEI